MAGRPDQLIVEVEFVDGTWTDVSGYVNVGEGTIEAYTGRGSPYEQCQAGSMSCLLDNPDGRFTPESAIITDPTSGAISANPYWPNVVENKRIRLRAVHATVDYPMWLGYIDAWQPTFDDSGYATWSQVAVTATDRFKLLDRRKFRTSMYQEVAHTAGAVAYLPLALDDPDTTTRIAEDRFRADYPGTVVDSALYPKATQTYTNDSHPPQLTGCLTLHGADPYAGGASPLTGLVAVPALDETSGASSWTISVGIWFNTTYNDGSCYLFHAGSASSTIRLEQAPFITDDGVVRVGPLGVTDAPIVASDPGYNDGDWHMVLAVFKRAAGTSQSVSLYVDGDLVGTASTVVSIPATDTLDGYWLAGGSFSRSARVNSVNKCRNADRGFYGSLAGLVLASIDLSASASDLFHAGWDAMSPESAHDRAVRVCGWAGMSSDEYDISSDMAAVIGVQEVDGRSALEILQDIAKAESAPMFIAGDGKLTMQARRKRVTTTPVQTFDADQDMDAAGLVLQLADEGAINEVVGQITGGASVTVSNGDTFVDYYSDRYLNTILAPLSDTVEAPWSTLGQARDAAWRRLAEKQTNRLRFPAVVVDPLTSVTDKWAAALATQIGDLDRVTSLPPATAGGAAQRDVFVESRKWTISSDSMTLSCDTTLAPGDLAQAVFDDTVMGRFGHDPGGCAVATQGCLAGTGTGTFTAAVTSLWSTTGAHYPATVRIDREELTISGVSGASSPQTFTVSARGANGTVPIAHQSGSVVDLWPVPNFAL